MKLITALLAAALLLAGCGSSDEPTDESAPAAAATPSSTPTPDASPSEPADDGVDVEIVVEDGKVTPQGGRVEVKVGQEVTLSITSDAEEEIHVHSDPEHTYQVEPGDAITETLTIDRPGQVAVEAHHLGVTIVQLVVTP